MIKIGIVAPQNHKEINKTLFDIFKKNHIIAAVEKNNKDIHKKLSFLEKSGIEYTVIIFENSLIYPVTLDILIMDNAKNNSIITYSLIECIKDKTILIYNTDNGYLPKIEHKNAIDYGFSQNSSVTVSSIEYHKNSKSFILCIQRPIYSLIDEEIPIGEIPVLHINNEDIINQLPAVISGLLCNIRVHFKKINFGINLHYTE